MIDFVIIVEVLFFIHLAFSFKVLKDKLRCKTLFLNHMVLSDELTAYLAAVGSSTNDYLALSLFERTTVYNMFLVYQTIGE
jgi:hypothetical protein